MSGEQKKKLLIEISPFKARQDVVALELEENKGRFYFYDFTAFSY